jgi:hypothetical protein
MRTLNLKPEVSCALPTSRRPPEDARPLFAGRQEGLLFLNEAGALPALARLALLLEWLAGATLGVVGVTAVFVNLMVCGSILFLGPDFVVELLAELS